MRRFLASLEEQDYPGQIEIIIVEDHSTDDSLEVVERKQRDLNSVRNAICTMMLIPAPPLPVGWLGKPNASHLDRLIIFPRQEMSVLLEKAGLMVTFVDLFAGLRCSTTMLNGQIVLISLAPVAGHDFSPFLEGKGGNGRIFAAVKNKRRTRTIGIGKFRIITTI